ncbi:MAG: hypothetical protein AAF639_43585 [Chloroflexota bacterium]
MNTKEREEKRVAIGLAPQRPTAKEVVSRPPSRRILARQTDTMGDVSVGPQRWFLVILFLAVFCSTLLLLTMRVFDAPLLWQQFSTNLRQGWQDGFGDNGNPVVNQLTTQAGLQYDTNNNLVRIEDNFDQTTLLFENDEQTQEWVTKALNGESTDAKWSLGTVAREGVYKIRTQTNHIAWTLLNESISGGAERNPCRETNA